MDLRQLRYLVAVTEHGSFTEAAAHLHVAQSAISRQVQTLESELGVELLRRSRRGAEPTEAGERVIARARRAIGEVEAARADLDAIRGLIRGRLRLGGMIPVGPFDLPEVVADFGRRHPGIEITLFEGPASEMLTALTAGRLDLSFCFRPPVAPSGIETMPVGADRLVVATGGDRDLGSGGRVGVAELAGRRLIAFPPGATARQRIDRAAAAAGVELRAAVETADLALIRRLVAAGFGVAVLPAAYLRGPGPEVTERELEPAIELEPVLAWREGQPLPPAGEAFRDHVAELIGSA